MTRVMRDSTDPGDIPPGADIVALYTDGAYAQPESAFDAFPGAARCHIAVNAWTAPAELGDCEQGDMTPVQTPGWVSRQWAHGIALPAVYCNRGNLDAVDEALHTSGVPVDRVGIVVATLDGSVVEGVTKNGYRIVACQDKGEAQTGGHYDESVVFADDWLPTHASQPVTTAGGGGAGAAEDGPVALLGQNGTGRQDIVYIDQQSGHLMWSESPDGLGALALNGPKDLGGPPEPAHTVTASWDGRGVYLNVVVTAKSGRLYGRVYDVHADQWEGWAQFAHMVAATG
jgi:hypothetical protein